MKRFSDHCHGCLCPSYTLPDNCKCGCHESLKQMMKVMGLSLDEVKKYIKEFEEQIENNPITEMRYEIWKIMHGKQVNKETAKFK
jgi:hypothetical protein